MRGDKVGKRITMWLGIGALTLGLAGGIAGCGSSGSGGSKSSNSSATGSGGGSGAGKKVKVGMVLVGPENDKGYNQAHYDGLLAAEKTFPEIKGTVIENASSPQDAVDAFTNFAQSGTNLVIGAGAQFAQAGTTVAPQFQKVTFVVENGVRAANAPNLHVYTIRQGVPAYIIGLLAAKLSKNHTVGFVGGQQIPPTTQGQEAFRAGAEKGSPPAKVLSTITGNYNDPTGASQAVSAQIASGADVIYAALDNGFPGAVKAVQQSGKHVLLFNQIENRCTESPAIVGFNLLDSSVPVEDAVGDFLHHKAELDTSYGLQDPSVQKMVLCPAFNKPALAKIVKQATAGINNGSIKLPPGV